MRIRLAHLYNVSLLSLLYRLGSSAGRCFPDQYPFAKLSCHRQLVVSDYILVAGRLTDLNPPDSVEEDCACCNISMDSL
jgi:hypothetical protein